MRFAAAALAVLLPLLAACSSTVPGPTPTSSVPTAPAPDLTSAPTVPPTGQRLTLDQSADFEDGLSIQVDNVRATTVPDGVAGAEGTAGEVVLADVVVTNGTRRAYDATSVVIRGYYRENVGAVMLSDPTGALGLGFSEVVPRGEQHLARVGFAIPAADARDVTLVVDPRDGTHGTIRFVGPAVSN